VKIDGESQWFTDPDGLGFRMIYRSRCEPCEDETESVDLDEVIAWQKGHRHIQMSYRTEFAEDVSSLPREVPGDRLEQREPG
jgi:hypothetical protein